MSSSPQTEFKDLEENIENLQKTFKNSVTISCSQDSPVLSASSQENKECHPGSGLKKAAPKPDQRCLETFDLGRGDCAPCTSPNTTKVEDVFYRDLSEIYGVEALGALCECGRRTTHHLMTSLACCDSSPRKEESVTSASCGVPAAPADKGERAGSGASNTTAASCDAPAVEGELIGSPASNTTTVSCDAPAEKGELLGSAASNTTVASCDAPTALAVKGELVGSAASNTTAVSCDAPAEKEVLLRSAASNTTAASRDAPAASAVKGELVGSPARNTTSALCGAPAALDEKGEPVGSAVSNTTAASRDAPAASAIKGELVGSAANNMTATSCGTPAARAEKGEPVGSAVSNTTAASCDAPAAAIENEVRMRPANNRRAVVCPACGLTYIHILKKNDSTVATKCGHIACKTCVKKAFSSGHAECFTCKKKDMILTTLPLLVKYVKSRRNNYVIRCMSCNFTYLQANREGLRMMCTPSGKTYCSHCMTRMDCPRVLRMSFRLYP